jgi:hypothetical protein
MQAMTDGTRAGSSSSVLAHSTTTSEIVSFVGRARLRRLAPTYRAAIATGGAEAPPVARHPMQRGVRRRGGSPCLRPSW